MRGERLRVLLALVWEEAAFGAIEPLERGLVPLSPGDVALLFTADGTDLAIADACLRAASERRTEQWAALETLLASDGKDDQARSLLGW